MPPHDFMPTLTRRTLLASLGAGLGSVALGSLLRGTARASDAPSTHFPARAKRVIYLHMVGGFSHVDLVDPKPMLRERHGEPCPDSLFEGKRFAFIKDRPTILGALREFRPSGSSGVEISNLLPGLQGIVDKVTLIRSMQTNEINHGPAQLLLLTGFPRFGRPSFGAWMSYGLGSENEDLPAFVALVHGNYPGAGNAVWGSGFLPSDHQGVELRAKGEPVLFLDDPDGVDRAARRRLVDTIGEMNRIEHAEYGDPEILARIRQYEMAFRMQTSVPEAMDLSTEPDDAYELYGARRGEASFARNCLLARRLVERGVRFVQLFDSGWDNHNGIAGRLPVKCGEVDRPASALVLDLERRGLLDETLVVFSTEFGRTPMAQAVNGLGQKAAPGRDHHVDAFSVWMAGGGTKPGLVYGETDEFGYDVVRDPVHVHDMNATILHLLGIDHERLTYRYQGRDFRLTDVHGEVVHDLIA